MATKEKLGAVRAQIDTIDTQLIELFNQRMQLADEAAKIKSEGNISLLDEKRETEIVEKAVAEVADDLKGETAAFFRALMGLSKSRQRKFLYGTSEEYFFPAPEQPQGGDVKVAFQGVPGAWGELAALQLFKTPELCMQEGFEDVFIAVKDKQTAYGVVPIENSQTGGIGEVHDLLRKYGCYIVGQTWVGVEHCLMAEPGTQLDDVREVFSHPEGFKQCRKFLRGRAWDLTACRNTAVAAEKVAKRAEKRYAAIGSARAAQLNGLSVLARDIADDSSNRTRFILIAAAPEYDENCNVVSVIFRTAHRAGALCDVLLPFLSEGINMSRLESRPTNESGKYCFFCDLEGNMSDERMQSALRQASSCSGYLDVLGCYRKDTEKR